MKTTRFSIKIVLALLIAAGSMGCGHKEWNSIQVGRSTAVDVESVFKTPVDPQDRYAYAHTEDKLSKDKVLMMVNLDEDGIVTSKYYWQSVRAPLFPFWRADSWEMYLQTQVAPPQLQEYTASLGPREEAILEYFGRILFDTSAHFQDVSMVFGESTSMKQILVFAANAYNARGDKQAILSEEGFEFDAGLYGDKCSMALQTIDQRQGIYTLSLKGYRDRNFFSGW